MLEATEIGSPGEMVELIKLAANGGAAVAVIVVTVHFLKFIRTERREQQEERKIERQGFKDSLESVVEAHERSLRDVSARLTDLRDHTLNVEKKVDTLSEHFRSRNGGS